MMKMQAPKKVSVPKVESTDVCSLSAVAGRLCKVLEEIGSLTVPVGGKLSEPRAQRAERFATVVEQAQRTN